jgi:hypothetical protein
MLEVCKWLQALFGIARDSFKNIHCARYTVSHVSIPLLALEDGEGSIV